MAEIPATPIQFLKGIGPKKAKSFNSIGINTVEDLLYHFPKRYEDRTNLSAINKLQEGSIQTIKAEILAKGGRQSFRRRGFSITEVAVGDRTGKIFCVWFNRPYLKEYFKVGDSLILYGKVERYGERLQISNPDFEILGKDAEESLSVGRITPVYSLPEMVSQRSLRHLIKYALDEYLPQLQDCLPFDIRSRNNLLNLAKSLLNIHFPENLNIQKQAYERLAFEEFFLFQVPLALRKIKKQERKGIAHKVDNNAINSFLGSLAFKLTKDQEKVLEEIKQDMLKPYPMQRLLQGDVGSGKTIVATIASFIVCHGGYQAAFMAPTEILAKQHYEKIGSQLSVVGPELKICLLTSSQSKKEKEKLRQEIKEGKVDLIIGTHALLEENIEFKNLGLVVIDEQHKFGVGQRALLPAKGPNLDCLIMTATPIPRTLAITLYGDLDISVIHELPPGRKPIKTLSFSQEESKKAYAFAKEELKEKKQVFIVYPVIEESYALDIAGAKKMYEELKEGEFKGFNLGLIHGRLKDEEQDQVMLKFKNKDLDLLIATTVLEVGIDIPNATCMIIEHAQRFGLAQLHQLRGRVGRGEYESFCILISDAQTEEARARISAMVRYGDGFSISEEDLKIRGPGEFFGRRQSGLTELKIANPLTQMQLLKTARDEAIKLVSNDPHLQLRQNLPLKEQLLQRFPAYQKLILVG